MARKLMYVFVREVPEKINDFVEIWKQNRELAQRLFLLFNNKETAFHLLYILFIMFIGR